MKNSNPLPLSAHKYQKVGLITVLIFFPLLVAVEWLEYSIFFFAPAQLSKLFVLTIGLGLTGIAFSKEQQEDERVEEIRYATFKITFFLLLNFLFYTGCIGVWGGSPFTLDPGVMAVAVLLVYIIMFRVGLNADPSIFYGNSDT